jgi:hypothetical protein
MKGISILAALAITIIVRPLTIVPADAPPRSYQLRLLPWVDAADE